MSDYSRSNIKLTIGVTDCSKYSNYANWIEACGLNLEIIKLSEKSNNYEDVKRCHGVVFTGGEDVHPQFYNKNEYLPFCHAADINQRRDEFELRLMEYTEHHKIPVLGICRGLQIFNVFLGGTLIPDIPCWGKQDHGKMVEGSDRYHPVKLARTSWLEETIGVNEGETNSNHHQSVHQLGKGLLVNAISEDGIVEGIERINPKQKGYLCLVQWHPERMNNLKSPFTLNLKESFINASKSLL